MIVTVTLKSGQELQFKDVEYAFQGDVLIIQNPRGVETYPRENILRVVQMQETVQETSTEPQNSVIGDVVEKIVKSRKAH